MNFYTNFAPDNVLIRTRRNVVEHKYNVRPVLYFSSSYCSASLSKKCN